MTSRIDLGELARRESEQIEWKEGVADVDDVVATLCAFANDLQNLGGGYVVCGAREEKDAAGFPRLVRTGLSPARFREVEGAVLTRCRSLVSPPLAPLVDELAGGTPEHRILVFTQPATGTAHTARRRHEGAKHFVRVSRTTIEARNGLLRDLLVRRGAMEPWDRRPASGATVGDLDLLALRDVLERMGVYGVEQGLEPYLSPDVTINPFVPSLCVAEPLSGVHRPRNFALLLFGRAPQRFVPGAFATCSSYPGTDRSAPRARRSDIAGTLLDQARRLQELLDAEVVTLFDKEDLRQPNAEKYPRRALQEAMVNGLAHRDYEAVDPTRVTIFGDRVEIVSPGSLPLGVTLEDLRSRAVTPRWRNQSLAWFLSRLQIAQAEGQGIPTIRRTMQAVGCPPPIFDATDAWVSCTLPAHPRFAQPAAAPAPRSKRAAMTASKAPTKTAAPKKVPAKKMSAKKGPAKRASAKKARMGGRG